MNCQFSTFHFKLEAQYETVNLKIKEHFRLILVHIFSVFEHYIHMAAGSAQFRFLSRSVVFVCFCSCVLQLWLFVVANGCSHCH